MNSYSKQEVLLIILFLCTGLFALVFFRALGKEIEKERQDALRYHVHLNQAFGTLTLTAESAYVYDFTTNQVLFDKNKTTLFPIASITKIMTARTFLDMTKTFSLTVPNIILSTYGDEGLVAGEEWSVTDFIRMMLVSSSNDAAEALRVLTPHTDFIKEMNLKALRLGLSRSHFLSATGLDTDDGEPTALSSAEDVTELLYTTYQAYPVIFESTTKQSDLFTSLSGISHELKNTNPVISLIPHILASKTGYTESAGGALVVLFQTDKGDIIGASVLHSTFTDRFTDIVQLVNATNTFSHLQSNALQEDTKKI